MIFFVDCGFKIPYPLHRVKLIAGPTENTKMSSGGCFMDDVPPGRIGIGYSLLPGTIEEPRNHGQMASLGSVIQSSLPLPIQGSQIRPTVN